jgi:hypothetical protein
MNVFAVDPVMNSILRRDKFSTIVGGAPTTIDITVQQTYTATVDFTYCGNPYTFNITKWRSSQLKNFLLLFHRHCQRDPQRFGSTAETTDDCIVLMDVEQKTNAIIHACKDIILYLSDVIQEQGRAVLDYGVWYREKHPEQDTYAEYIMKVTCHCIVHSDFFNHKLIWNVTPFGH